MPQSALYTRPSFEEALKAWTILLQQRGLPAELTWVFRDNLCFEADAARPSGNRLSFQTSITPPPSDAERIAYGYFADFRLPIVFYRAGTWANRSICLVLCDEWFRSKREPDGYLPRHEWLMSFRPGAQEEIMEISDHQRWSNRIIRNRPVHDLDFAMDLRAVHEILAHGRVLSTYEHYALRLLHMWRRILDPQSLP
jgi:hypothetical protein